jgi:hypothetical protein
VEVLGIEQHGFAELVAGGRVFADFEVGVGEILAHGGAGGGGFDGFQEEGDGVVIAAGAQGFVGFVERLVGRVGGLGGARADARRSIHSRMVVKR